MVIKNVEIPSRHHLGKDRSSEKNSNSIFNCNTVSIGKFRLIAVDHFWFVCFLFRSKVEKCTLFCLDSVRQILLIAKTVSPYIFLVNQNISLKFSMLLVLSSTRRCNLALRCLNLLQLTGLFQYYDFSKERETLTNFVKKRLSPSAVSTRHPYLISRITVSPVSAGSSAVAEEWSQEREMSPESDA